LSVDLAITLALLAVTVALFVRGRPRTDVVALMMIAALPLSGIVTVREALAGFSEPNVVLVALLFVLGEGLVRTGVARRVGDLIAARAAGSKTRLLVLLMVAVVTLGSIMSSTAIVAIFIPVVLRICRRTRIGPAKLMLPLAFAALISGMMTLVATTPNLIVNAEVVRQGHAGFHFFAITPIGLAVLGLGMAYMLLVNRFLPEAQDPSGMRPRPTFRDWIHRYRLEESEYRVRVEPGSSIIDRRLKRLGLRERGLNLLAIKRRLGRRPLLLRPTRNTRLRAGDELLLDVRLAADAVTALAAELGCVILPVRDTGSYLLGHAQDLGMVEVIVPAESRFVGQTVRAARVRRKSGLTVIGMRRGRDAITEGLLDQQLKVGDTLLVTGFWPDIRRLQQDSRHLVVLHMPAEFDEVLPAAGRAAQALGILALVVFLMVTGLVANVLAVLVGVLLMGLFGCLDLSSAYRSINWQSLMLIVGMLPFAVALQHTGGVDLAAQLLLTLIGEGSPSLLLAALFTITVLLVLLISNTATAVLMAPVALAVAGYLGASPYPFAMIVALACSTAFMTPVASPVNTLVMGPGNYSFGDFVKFGLPFSLLVLVTCVLLVPLLLPLYP
jgi:di/tricarboxylate transporter